MSLCFCVIIPRYNPAFFSPPELKRQFICREQNPPGLRNKRRDPVENFRFPRVGDVHAHIRREVSPWAVHLPLSPLRIAAA